MNKIWNVKEKSKMKKKWGKKWIDRGTIEGDLRETVKVAIIYLTLANDVSIKKNLILVLPNDWSWFCGVMAEVRAWKGKRTGQSNRTRCRKMIEKQGIGELFNKPHLTFVYLFLLHSFHVRLCFCLSSPRSCYLAKFSMSFCRVFGSLTHTHTH